MEKIGGYYNEKNPYESYVNLQKFIEKSVLSFNFVDSKLDEINQMLDIFNDLEGFICSSDDGRLYNIKKRLGTDFENLINDLTEGYRLALVSKLEKMALSLENPQTIDIIKLNIEEIVSSTIEKVMNCSNLEFSTKLNHKQIEYLSRNGVECKNFIAILEAIGKIKSLPSVSGKMLSIEHLTAPINKIKVNFRGRMTKTNNEDTNRHIDISNCVETNLSGNDRFIFAIENTSSDSNKTTIDIKVLGDPPYKH